MWERIIERVRQYFLYLRPLLLIFLSLLFALGLNWQLQLQEFSWEGEPLRKIPPEDLGFSPSEPDTAIAKEKEITASISGAVEKPGVYTFASAESPLVADLLRASGGLSSAADELFVARNINLAESLQPQSHIYVPTLSERQLPSQQESSESVTSPSSSELVNINTATRQELESLPGVGPSTADKIIASRPYQDPSDILDVSGIGEATYEKLKQLIEV